MIPPVVIVFLVRLFTSYFASESLPAFDSLSTAVHLGIPTMGPASAGPLPYTPSPETCLFLWPIQRYDLHPVTTLNDVAKMISLFEMAPKVSSSPHIGDDVCPNTLPIQRHVMFPVTSLNDVAALVGQAVDENKAKSNTPLTLGIRPPNIYVLSVVLVIVVWTFYMLIAKVFWNMHYSYHCLYGKEYLVLNRHQRRRLTQQLRRQQRQEHIKPIPDLNQYRWFLNDKDETVAEYHVEQRPAAIKSEEPSENLAIAEKAKVIVQLQDEADQLGATVQLQENRINSLDMELDQKALHIHSNERQLDCQSIVTAYLMEQWSNADASRHAATLEIQDVNENLDARIHEAQSVQSQLEADLGRKREDITQLGARANQLNNKNRELETDFGRLKALRDGDMAIIDSLNAQIALLVQKSTQDEIEIARLNALTTSQVSLTTVGNINDTVLDARHSGILRLDEIVEADGADDKGDVELPLISPPTTPEASRGTCLPEDISVSPIVVSCMVNVNLSSNPSHSPVIESSEPLNPSSADIQLGERFNEFEVENKEEISLTPAARVECSGDDKSRDLNAPIWPPQDRFNDIASPPENDTPLAPHDNPTPTSTTPKDGFFGFISDGKPRGLNDSMWAPKTGQARPTPPRQPSDNNPTPTSAAPKDNFFNDEKPRGLNDSIWAPKPGQARSTPPLQPSDDPTPTFAAPKDNFFNDEKPRGLNTSMWAPKPGQSRSTQPHQSSRNGPTNTYGGQRVYSQPSGTSRDVRRDDRSGSRQRHRYTEDYGPHFNTSKRRGPQDEYNLHDIR